MKKQFLKSLALVAMLLCGLTASAVSGIDWSDTGYQWIGVDANADPTNNGSKYKIEKPEGLNVASIQLKGEKCAIYVSVPAGIKSATVKGVIEGAGMWMYLENFTAQETQVTIEHALSSITFWVYYVNGVPSGESAETFKPTMTSASLVSESVTYNSVVINVAGTDKETEKGEDVAVTRFKVVYGETSKTYTATNGQITITGLTPGTAYSFTIYAVDAVGNVSEAGIKVEATTSADAPIISGTCSGKRSDNGFTNPYNYTFTTSGYEDNASVLVEFTFNDTKEGVVAFLWMNHSEFQEKQMAYDGTTKKASYTIENLKKDDVIKVAVKFAYAGGMSVTSYIEYTVGTSCEAVVDNILPTMGEVELVSVSFNSAIISVSGTDKETEDGQEVAVTRFKVVYDETSNIYSATDGKITVTGLTPNTTYSFDIYAVDGSENVSTNFKTVEATTVTYPAAPAAPVHAQDKVRSIYSDTYKSALAHDFAKNTWSGIQYEEITLDENNHYLFYTTNVTWFAWGDKSDGANAIIAAEGYNDGTHVGLDLSVMDYLHVDIFVDANCVSGEVFINDEKLAGLGTLEGGKWNSLNLSLEGLKSGLTPTEKTINNTRWIKFDGLNDVSMVIIDNVYAWKNGTSTAVDANEVATKVSKTIENGQVVIIREGVKYDVTGRAIER
ncbi:MAG: hypothetical protein SPD96_04765 [Paludibacteraceae bacterium]|nr:hypothetical protein [Paludibacteraceae bacterium]